MSGLHVNILIGMPVLGPNPILTSPYVFIPHGLPRFILGKVTTLLEPNIQGHTFQTSTDVYIAMNPGSGYG